MGRTIKTDREKYITRHNLGFTIIMMCDGWTRKDVAEHLQVNEKTVASWINEDMAIKEKLHACISGKIAFPFTNSLSIFIMYLYVKAPDIYKNMLTVYRAYSHPMLFHKDPAIPLFANSKLNRSRSQMVSLINKGWTLKAIGEHLNVNEKTVAAWLRSVTTMRGLQPDNLNDFMNDLRQHRPKKYNYLLPYYNEFAAPLRYANAPWLLKIKEALTHKINGMTQKAIAAQMNLNEKTVSKWVREFQHLIQPLAA